MSKLNRECPDKLRRILIVGVMIAVVSDATGVYAGTVNSHIRVPASGVVAWAAIPDPQNPGKSLTSVVGAGGMVSSIPAEGRGARYVEWIIKGLAVGYYRVQLHYFRHSGNASGVLVQKKTSADSSYITWKTRLDQRYGNSVKTSTNSFERTIRDITPYAVSNMASYIWVPRDPGASKGTLRIRLSDSGCIGGRIVADTVVVDLVSTVR